MKKKILILAGIVAAFLVLAYGFVPQVLSGKIVNQSDISGWKGMAKEMMDWNASHPDNRTAWTGSMFGGMPAATIQTPSEGDWTQTVYDLLLTGKRPATYLFISLLGAFLLMLSLGISPLVAAGGAIAVTFCAYNLQIIQVGHNTKMQAIAFLPWVLAALVYTYRKATSDKGLELSGALLGSASFGLAVSFQVKANHPQISYYLALMIVIYAIVLFVSLVRKKARHGVRNFFIASAMLLVMGCVGIGTNAIKIIPTLEYTPYSMRGGSTASSDGQKETKGLDLDYATAWSYGWQELPNILIPNYNGGSSAGAVNPKSSKTYELLQQAGQPNLKQICKHLPLYWGPQPFTAGPMYMGAITIFLFILGLCWYKGKEKWWLVAATLLAVLLALGNHFMWFTALFYKYVPLYNKFRTVSMALVVLQFTLPTLGFLVLDRVVKEKSDTAELKSSLKLAFFISAGLCLFFMLVMSLFGTFSGSSDAGQQDILVAALSADRQYLMLMDGLRSICFILSAFLVLMWGLSVPKSAPKTFASDNGMALARRRTAAIFVCLLVLLDLFPIGKRYLKAEDFVTPRNFESQFNQRPVDKMILEDKDPSYRVLDLTVNVFNDSHPSYWHKNIGGYSPAKLQRYQEFIDRTLNGEINSLYKAVSGAATVQEAEESLPYLPGLAEMNLRYIIVGADVPPLRYAHAKGNAWFEDSDGSDVIEMTSYAPNELKYSYSSAVGGRAVFSEVYYPEGWTLKTEDGSELEIEVYDGILRSAVLPAGSHELTMTFSPRSYSVGEGVSRACSITIILLVILAAAAAAMDRKSVRVIPES